MQLPDVCDNVMRTVDPNNNIWLTEATRMDGNDSGMLNDGTFALFWTIGGIVGPRGGKTKNGDFVCM